MTMMFRFARFNTYLCCALALLIGAGCQSAARKEKKIAAVIELHLEVNRDGGEDNAPVPIGKDGSFQVNVDKDPFLTTADLTEALLVDEPGDLFSIVLKFNWRGTT